MRLNNWLLNYPYIQRQFKRDIRVQISDRPFCLACDIHLQAIAHHLLGERSPITETNLTNKIVKIISNYKLT
jgi:hypothetical protein